MLRGATTLDLARARIDPPRTVSLPIPPENKVSPVDEYRMDMR
jgi:hypothetical protein